jgi:HEAT repeat protein
MREVLRLNSQALALLLYSALHVGQQVDYWLSQIKDPWEQVAILVEAVNSKLIPIRRRAIVTLGQTVSLNPETASSKVIESLTTHLSDPDIDIRNQAIDALEQVVMANHTITNPKIASTLIELLSDQDWNVRDRAADTFNQVVKTNPEIINLQVVEALIHLIFSEESGVRRRAENALGYINLVKPTLVSQLLLKQDETLRITVTEALEQVKIATEG